MCDTPDDYYQIGSLMLGSTSVFGKRGSNGWSQAMVPNVARRTTRYGTVRKRSLGPPRRTWTWSWADGVYNRFSRSTGTPDYVELSPAGSNGAPLATRDEVWRLLWGLLEETDGGAIPVLAAAALPPDGFGMQTDRTLFVYGTLDSAVQFNQVVGDEGSDEFGRVDPVQVTEVL